MEDLAFWSVAALMVLGVTGLLVAASWRGRAASEPVSDLPVYRDQLAEVERDLARGTLAPEEAQRTRTEIARRLLEADRQAKGASAVTARGGWVAAGGIALAMAGAVGLYAQMGLPWYPDMPLAQRLAQADAAMATRPAQAAYVVTLPPAPAPQADAEYTALIEELRAAVDPATATDPRGLELLAFHELQLGNASAAEAAQRRLIEIRPGGATAQDHSALAEILITAAQGYVSPEAEVELKAALAKDPTDGLARYYAGLMFAQGGRYDRAFALWEPLLRESPEGAPWLPPIRAQIEEVAALAGTDFALPPETAPKGPSPEDIAAAEAMTPEDRQAMIEGMVQQLSERLAAQGGTAEEWAQLIQALGILGRVGEAATVLDDARETFADEPKALETLEAAGRAAGVIR